MVIKEASVNFAYYGQNKALEAFAEKLNPHHHGEYWDPIEVWEYMQSK